MDNMNNMNNVYNDDIGIIKQSLRDIMSHYAERLNELAYALEDDVMLKRTLASEIRDVARDLEKIPDKMGDEDGE